MADEPRQTERGSPSPRDIADRPLGVATLADISDKVDDARQVAHDTRDEFREFRGGLVGVPGVSRGALGEIRDSLASNATELREANRQRAAIDVRSAARGKEFLEALPSLINQTVRQTDNDRMRAQFSAARGHVWTALAMTASGVIVALVIFLLHISGH